METEKPHYHSFIVHSFTRMIDWGDDWLVVSHWFFRKDGDIFRKIEILMLVMALFCFALMLSIPWIPALLYPLLIAFFVQRILEFVIVYSRNFILKRGRVFSHFHSEQARGVWLIIMFCLNVTQIVMVFGMWYHVLTLMDPGSFTKVMGTLDSLYFSAVTFLTIGFGDIAPLSVLAKLSVILQGALTFFVVVIVVNGLISTHFGGGQPSSEMK
jgi:hypothetical protein